MNFVSIFKIYQDNYYTKRKMAKTIEIENTYHKYFENELENKFYSLIKNDEKYPNIIKCDGKEWDKYNDDQLEDYLGYNNNGFMDKELHCILDIVSYISGEGYYILAIKSLIIYFIQILLYFNCEFDSIEIKTKEYNYIYKNKSFPIQEQEKEIFNNIDSQDNNFKNISENIEKEVSQTDIKLPKIYSTKMEDIISDDMSSNNNLEKDVNINNSDKNKSSPNEKIQNKLEDKSSFEEPSYNSNEYINSTKENNKKVNKKYNYYTLENAIKLIDKTIDIQDELDDDMEKEINDSEFKDIIFDLYINNYDNIIIYYKLFDYLEKENNYIEFINKTYNIDTENKKKKLKTKITRCNDFYCSINNNFNLNINKCVLSPSFLAKMKTKDFNEFIKYIETLKK